MSFKKTLTTITAHQIAEIRDSPTITWDADTKTITSFSPTSVLQINDFVFPVESGSYCARTLAKIAALVDKESSPANFKDGKLAVNTGGKKPKFAVPSLADENGTFATLLTFDVVGSLDIEKDSLTDLIKIATQFVDKDNSNSDLIFKDELILAHDCYSVFISSLNFVACEDLKVGSGGLNSYLAPSAAEAIKSFVVAFPSDSFTLSSTEKSFTISNEFAKLAIVHNNRPEELANRLLGLVKAEHTASQETDVLIEDLATVAGFAVAMNVGDRFVLSKVGNMFTNPESSFETEITNTASDFQVDAKRLVRSVKSKNLMVRTKQNSANMVESLILVDNTLGSISLVKTLIA